MAIIEIETDRPTCDEDVIEMLSVENANLKDMLRKFFEFLDRTDVSEEGRVFHPVSINCCRAVWIEPLQRLLEKLKKASRL